MNSRLCSRRHFQHANGFGLGSMALASLLQRERIGHVILDDRKASAALHAGLAIAKARKTDEAADSQRWSLPMETAR